MASIESIHGQEVRHERAGINHFNSTLPERLRYRLSSSPKPVPTCHH
jgi:hypothetical protein